MRSWIGGNAEGRRTFPPKKMFKGYSNFMVFWSKKMEVWFEKQLFRKAEAAFVLKDERVWKRRYTLFKWD